MGARAKNGTFKSVSLAFTWLIAMGCSGPWDRFVEADQVGLVVVEADTFSVQSFPSLDTGQRAEGISGGDASELYRVGTLGFVSRYDGTQWEALSPGGQYDFLEDVALTETEVIAVGKEGVIWTSLR